MKTPSASICVLPPTVEVMTPMFATSSPQAKESRMSKSSRSVIATVMSQNVAMPSLPWCPLASGSKCEGPTGSSTTAFSANSASHSSFARRRTASMERWDARRAGCSDIGHDGVGELLQGVLLGGQLSVEGDAVKGPGNDDRVGHPSLGLLAVTVQPEAVHTHRLDLEWLRRAAVLLAQLAQAVDDLTQVLDLDHRGGPAVTQTGRPPECGGGVPADVDRHGLGGCRPHLQTVEVEELPVELDHAATQDELEHLDRLVGARALALEQHPTPLEL